MCCLHQESRRPELACEPPSDCLDYLANNPGRELWLLLARPGGPDSPVAKPHAKMELSIPREDLTLGRYENPEGITRALKASHNTLAGRGLGVSFDFSRWYPGRDSNPHALGAEDFESSVSTIPPPGQ